MVRMVLTAYPVPRIFISAMTSGMVTSLRPERLTSARAASNLPSRAFAGSGRGDLGRVRHGRSAENALARFNGEFVSVACRADGYCADSVERINLVGVRRKVIPEPPGDAATGQNGHCRD